MPSENSGGSNERNNQALPPGGIPANDCDMGYWRYKRLELSRAWSDFWRSLDKSAVQSVPVAIFGCGLLYLLRGTEAALSEFWDYLICGVGAVALWLAIKFLWYLYLAPWRLWREKDAAVRHSESVAAPTAENFSYAIWDTIDPLELYQAACLWVGASPPESAEPELTGEAAGALHMLKRAIEKRELHPVLTENERSLLKMQVALARAAPSAKLPEPSKRMIVTRAELQRFAQARAEQPLFLFPQARQHRRTPRPISGPGNWMR